MKYIYIGKNKDELIPRKEYLYDIFKKYLVTYNCDSKYIILEEFLRQDYDICFIIGHINDVRSYFQENKELILEKTVVIVTCDPNNIVKNNKKWIKAKKKKVYISKGEQISIPYSDGKKVGLNFNITESELLFYRKVKKGMSIERALESTFVRVCG